jgi:hypothetical protein
MEIQKRENRLYINPEISEIKLDNEISLALASTPPSGPNETLNRNAPQYFDNDPYKRNMG